MKTFKTFYEMAIPTKEMLGHTWYHGASTLSEKEVEDIIHNGLRAGNLTDVRARGLLKPVFDKIYITKNIGYAQIFAMGGDIAGNDDDWGSRSENEEGYIFVIDNQDIIDMLPDEDTIGEFIERLERGKEDKDEWAWFVTFVNNNVDKNSQIYRKAIDGEVAYQAKLGKMLLKKLSKQFSDEYILKLINHLGHSATEGKEGRLHVKEVWRIIKSEDIKKLKKDGSNFFQVATKIYPK